MSSRMDNALNELNATIDAGAELPDVSWRIARSHRVTCEKLELAYEAQFARDPREGLRGYPINEY